MLNLNKNLPSKLLIIGLVLSVLANVAGVLEFAGIRANDPKCDPIVKAVVVHDTVTVTETKHIYQVEYDTVRVDRTSGKPFITIDEYIDHNVQLPAEYQNDYIYFGFMRKSPHQFWGRKFGSSIKDFSLGCHGTLKRDIPTHPGWVWCTGEWVATFKEPIPMWTETNKH